MNAYAGIDPETGEFQRIYAAPMSDSEQEARQTSLERDRI
jgi:hypothetical protein